MAGRLVFTTVLLLLALTCVQSRFLKNRQPKQQQVAEGSSSEEDGPAQQQVDSDESDSDSSSSEEQIPVATTAQPDLATARPMGTTRSSGLPMGTTSPPAPLGTNQPEDDTTDYVTEIDSTATMDMVTCMMNCPLELDIVCGTDGVNYQSECVLIAEACKRGDTGLRVAYRGPCNAGTITPNAP